MQELWKQTCLSTFIHVSFFLLRVMTCLGRSTCIFLSNLKMFAGWLWGGACASLDSILSLHKAYLLQNTQK